MPRTKSLWFYSYVDQSRRKTKLVTDINIKPIRASATVKKLIIGRRAVAVKKTLLSASCVCQSYATVDDVRHQHYWCFLIWALIKWEMEKKPEQRQCKADQNRCYTTDRRTMRHDPSRLEEHVWNNRIDWPQCHETNADKTTAPLNFAKKSHIASKGMTDYLIWGLDQSLDIISPKKSSHQAQRPLTQFSAQKIDAGHHKRQQESGQIVFKEYFATYKVTVQLLACITVQYWNSHLKSAIQCSTFSILWYDSIAFRNSGIYVDIKKRRDTSVKCVFCGTSIYYWSKSKVRRWG